MSLQHIRKTVSKLKSSEDPNSFRNKHNILSRKQESTRILGKYPERRPLIVEKDINSDIQEIDKKKYLVPNDLTVGQFIYVIRKRIKLSPEKALYLFIDGTIPPTAALISSMYDRHKGEDGFLVMIYSAENTFGSSFIA